MFNDVGRDFLLLRELDRKKIMLIGPRSNANGLFHGPFWTYLNYPVFKISHGNPVASGWFWLFLGIFSTVGGFMITKKYFGMLPALTFSYFNLNGLVTHINGMFHSDAPVYFIVFFYITIFLYFREKRARFLFLHFLITGIIFQLNIGLGIPITILTSILTLWIIVKNKLWTHLVFFLTIPAFLANFIVFDLRHNFFLYNSFVEVWRWQKYWHPLPLGFFLKNRFDTTINLQLIYSYNLLILLFIFGAVMFATISELKNKKLNSHYQLIVYYYFGYMLLTFMNKGVILSHFVYFLMPLTAFWFASLFRGKYLKLLMPILFGILFVNSDFSGRYANEFVTTFFGRDRTSWRAMTTVAENVLKRRQKEPFGYFVFAPDAFAYGPRYAMLYNFESKKAKSFEYKKLDFTYVIAEPPPKNDPYMTYVWWRKNPVKITKEPDFTKSFPSGFVIEEFKLSADEQKVAHDKNLEIGIHFR